MRRSLTTFALSSFCMVSIAACASAPKTSTLMTGISPDDVSKTYTAGQMRAATDPVCVNFYSNAKTYLAAANKPNQGKNMVTSLGLGILASVATGGMTGIGSGIGQMAARQTVSAVVTQGGRMALKGMESNSGPGKNIVKVAEELQCPVSITT